MSDAQASPIRAAWATQDPLLTTYYDTEWGMPVRDEAGVFEQLTLEAFQAGLTWLTVLRKREAFRAAFEDFDPEVVAGFGDDDIDRLMHDQGIIRNRTKIVSTIENARATLALHKRGATLSSIVWSHMPEVSPSPETDDEVPSSSPESTALAQDLRSNGFRCIGPTTAFALMASIGVVDAHLVDSHRRGASGIWNIDGTRRGGPAMV